MSGDRPYEAHVALFPATQKEMAAEACQHQKRELRWPSASMKETLPRNRQNNPEGPEFEVQKSRPDERPSDQRFLPFVTQRNQLSPVQGKWTSGPAVAAFPPTMPCSAHPLFSGVNVTENKAGLEGSSDETSERKTPTNYLGLSSETRTLTGSWLVSC